MDVSLSADQTLISCVYCKWDHTFNLTLAQLEIDIHGTLPQNRHTNKNTVNLSLAYWFLRFFLIKFVLSVHISRVPKAYSLPPYYPSPLSWNGHNIILSVMWSSWCNPLCKMPSWHRASHTHEGFMGSLDVGRGNPPVTNFPCKEIMVCILSLLFVWGNFFVLNHWLKWS